MPFLKDLFLMFTESNSRNFVSEIMANSLKKLLTKIYRFQWDFSIQILSQFLCILKQNSLLQLLCDFAKSSSVPFSLLCTYVYTYLLLSLWILKFASFFCLLFKFRWVIYSKTVNVILSFESFVTNDTSVFLFNTR